MATAALAAPAETLATKTSTVRSSTLLRDARAGDREALAQLVLPYASTLYRAGLRLTKNVYDAEDIRQESLLKALARLDQFTGVQSAERDELQAWVFRIATNTAIDVLRRRREGKVFSLDQAEHNSEDSPALQLRSRGVDPEQEVLRRESRRQLAAVITQLPRDLRQVCLLIDVLQYSPQEVAGRLGISNVAVRLRLFRARRRLREKLEETLGRKRKSVSPRQSTGNSAARSKNWTVGRQTVASCPAMSFACGGD
jgi:RNA polymerase sigma-70 factor, ECF subfamily